MSVRRWVFTVVSGLCVFAAFGWAALQTGRIIGETEGRYQSNVSSYAHYFEKEMRRFCLGLDDINQAECIRRIVNSTNEQQRAEQVLVAQTDMARWSLWMLIVTTAMAAVTALGVYYVWRTLLATQKMAIDTRDIGQKQTRSFVNILPIQMAGYFDDFKLEFCIVNSGMTGAFDVKLRCTVVIYLSGREKTSASGWKSIGVMEGGRRMDEVAIFLPITEMGVRPEFYDTEGCYAMVDVFVYYSDVFDVAHINHLRVGLYPRVGGGGGMMILKNEEHSDQKE